MVGPLGGAARAGRGAGGSGAARLSAGPAPSACWPLSAISIASGWALYVWAVNHGRNLESSLGYYINPLMNMAAGALLFRERIDRIGLSAIALAIIGVVIQTIALGHLPVISLVLATTFWIYGLIRRQIDVDAQAGLLIECLFMAGSGTGGRGLVQPFGDGACSGTRSVRRC